MFGRDKFFQGVVWSANRPGMFVCREKRGNPRLKPKRQPLIALEFCLIGNSAQVYPESVENYNDRHESYKLDNYRLLRRLCSYL